MSRQFDPRLYPVRADLAADVYKGKFQAEKYVEGTFKTVAADALDMRRYPDLESSLETQLLYGETVCVYEETSEGWAWGQLLTDGYVGWFSANGLTEHRKPTHRVRAIRTFRYPGPDLKFPVLGCISIGSLVTVVGTAVTRGLEYALLSDGSAVVAKHLLPLESCFSDWVAIAETFIETPYLWGGRTSNGLDCSALVQLSTSLAGYKLRRDADLQEKQIDSLIAMEDPQALERGDLIFWKGHVGIISASNRLLHANGHSMTVAAEPLDDAIQRIASTEWGDGTGIRRLGSDTINHFLG